jgi:aldose sugar dehydrogenase
LTLTIILFLPILLFLLSNNTGMEIYSVGQGGEGREPVHPQIDNQTHIHSKFKVEPIIDLGFEFPTSMAFVAPNDILVLERNQGIVKRIVNGTMLEKPLLDIPVVNSDGLLGIAVSKDYTPGKTYVFLFYTKPPTGYNADVKEKIDYDMVNRTFGYVRECNCLYRYELVGDSLVDPRLILSLPSYPGGQHHGGKILKGPDNNLYVVVGEIEGYMEEETKTKAQNYIGGREPDGRSGILRITQEGEVVGRGILGNDHPLNLYYAYGIRNSFGMDFDPLTGTLWDTENGPDHGDEINLVHPGFNSGFHIIDGMSDGELDSEGLEDFNGRGKYSDPEFVWEQPVGVTAIKFLNSDKYGKEYENDILVGDINNGNIYHFDINKERTGLALDGPLEDKIANTAEETQLAIFARGFGGITDIQLGPDGYIYVISHGSLFRIVPKS